MEQYDQNFKYFLKQKKYINTHDTPEITPRGISKTPSKF